MTGGGAKGGFLTVKPKIARRFLNRTKWKRAVARLRGGGRSKSLFRMEAKAIKTLRAERGLA